VQQEQNVKTIPYFAYFNLQIRQEMYRENHTYTQEELPEHLSLATQRPERALLPLVKELSAPEIKVLEYLFKFLLPKEKKACVFEIPSLFDAGILTYYWLEDNLDLSESAFLANVKSLEEKGFIFRDTDLAGQLGTKYKFNNEKLKQYFEYSPELEEISSYRKVCSEMRLEIVDKLETLKKQQDIELEAQILMSVLHINTIPAKLKSTLETSNNYCLRTTRTKSSKAHYEGALIGYVTKNRVQRREQLDFLEKFIKDEKEDLFSYKTYTTKDCDINIITALEKKKIVKIKRKNKKVCYFKLDDKTFFKNIPEYYTDICSDIYKTDALKIDYKERTDHLNYLDTHINVQGWLDYLYDLRHKAREKGFGIPMTVPELRRTKQGREQFERDLIYAEKVSYAALKEKSVKKERISLTKNEQVMLDYWNSFEELRSVKIDKKVPSKALKNSIQALKKFQSGKLYEEGFYTPPNTLPEGFKEGKKHNIKDFKDGVNNLVNLIRSKNSPIPAEKKGFLKKLSVMDFLAGNSYAKSPSIFLSYCYPEDSFKEHTAEKVNSSPFVNLYYDVLSKRFPEQFPNKDDETLSLLNRSIDKMEKRFEQVFMMSEETELNYDTRGGFLIRAVMTNYIANKPDTFKRFFICSDLFLEGLEEFLTRNLRKGKWNGQILLKR